MGLKSEQRLQNWNVKVTRESSAEMFVCSALCWAGVSLDMCLMEY